MLLICLSILYTFLGLFYISQQKTMPRKRKASTLQHTYLKCPNFKTFNHMQLVFKVKKKKSRHYCLTIKFINICMYIVKNSHGISIWAYFPLNVTKPQIGQKCVMTYYYREFQKKTINCSLFGVTSGHKLIGQLLTTVNECLLGERVVTICKLTFANTVLT